MTQKSHCMVVTVLPCSTPTPHLESPLGCQNCGMLDWWTAFSTEEECNAAYIAQNPNEFKDGKHISE